MPAAVANREDQAAGTLRGFLDRWLHRVCPESAGWARGQALLYLAVTHCRGRYSLTELGPGPWSHQPRGGEQRSDEGVATHRLRPRLEETLGRGSPGNSQSG